MESVSVLYRPKRAEEIHRNMSAIRSRDNQTERSLRSLLHARGLRFRLHPKAIVGKPDLVFPRERVALFVDGDFWHARLLREEGMHALRTRMKAADTDYWLTKFARRIARDDEVTATLRSSGWVVLRFWESELKADPRPAVRKIEKLVRGRRKEIRVSSLTRKQATRSANGSRSQDRKGDR